MPVVSQVGSRLPLHATGVGKVLLAYAPDEVQAAVLADLTPDHAVHGHPARPAARAAAPGARDGYAHDRDEMTLGACSVAVPVRDREGGVVAALGVVVPDLKRDRPPAGGGPAGRGPGDRAQPG